MNAALNNTYTTIYCSTGQRRYPDKKFFPTKDIPRTHPTPLRSPYQRARGTAGKSPMENSN